MRGGDLACVPHNYMIGAFVFGDLAGADASQHQAYAGELPQDQLREAHELVYRPLRNPDGPPQPQVEYKLRRFVNDYVAPPKSGARLSLALEAFERMRDDIAAMGARSPHELMRCAEVTFIRDCAEMAARASLARTESRWGLYHERVDLPERDDASWFHHLDLHKSPSGSMVFTARPVEPYLVPVEGFAPTGGPARLLGEVHPEQVATAGARDAAPVAARTPAAGGGAHTADGAAGAPSTGSGADAGSGADTAAGGASGPGVGAEALSSPRLLGLLALAEEEPDLDALRPFLDDPAAPVRRVAVTVLTETVPPGTGPALAGALSDSDAEVRATAAASLRELVETLPAEPALREPLVRALAGPDPVVKAAALDILRALRLGDTGVYADALDDEDTAVRIEAVRALVSVDAAEPLTRVAADPSREVRVAVAKALATLGTAAGELASTAPEAGAGSGGGGLLAALDPLTGDPDALVRGAAFEALAATGCPAPFAGRAVAAQADGAWQVRAGAASALGAADPDTAVPALAKALADPNADVRKAVVLALLRHAEPGVPGTPDGPVPPRAAGVPDAVSDARAALATAVTDTDADVRAYAARAGTPQGSGA